MTSEINQNLTQKACSYLFVKPSNSVTKKQKKFVAFDWLNLGMKDFNETSQYPHILN